jgi:hypothetical protein
VPGAGFFVFLSNDSAAEKAFMRGFGASSFRQVTDDADGVDIAAIPLMNTLHALEC